MGRAKEATEVSKLKSYELGVQETEVHLADELAEVCKDYCKEAWIEVLNLVGVLATSEWRQARNVYYPSDIREVSTELPPLAALALISYEQPLIIHAPLPFAEVP